jgi:MtfA peptidase
MIFSWLRRRRRRKLLATPFPEAWLPWLLNLPFYQGLDEDERARLHDILRVIVAEKNWEGCGGLEITEEMKVVVAAQAALLLLGIEHDHHRRARTILIYPSTYKLDSIRQNASGIVGDSAHVAGQAWYRGPVILSWDAVEHGAWDPKDGHNLVLHEFAHKLDMMDGYVNGTPVLQDRADYKIWARIMTVEFRALKEAARKGRGTVMDRYGATNEAEFFSVATESFFEKSLQMEKRHPDLYGLLRDFFRQDPAERLRRAHRAGSSEPS